MLASEARGWFAESGVADWASEKKGCPYTRASAPLLERVLVAAGWWWEGGCRNRGVCNPRVCSLCFPGVSLAIYTKRLADWGVGRECVRRSEEVTAGKGWEET